MRLMNMNNSDASVSTEIERLESERLIGESLVATAKDRYASEIGNASEIERMVKCASVKPKTYKIPRRMKNRRNCISFVDKIKKLLGL